MAANNARSPASFRSQILVHIDEIQRNGRRRRLATGMQNMPDIATPAEQPEKLLLVLRQLAPEQPFQLDLIDHPQRTPRMKVAQTHALVTKRLRSARDRSPQNAAR